MSRDLLYLNVELWYANLGHVLLFKGQTNITFLWASIHYWIKLCQKVVQTSWHCWLLIFIHMKHKSPILFVEIQPQTSKKPPPCFGGVFRHSVFYHSPALWWPKMPSAIAKYFKFCLLLTSFYVFYAQLSHLVLFSCWMYDFLGNLSTVKMVSTVWQHWSKPLITTIEAFACRVNFWFWNNYADSHCLGRQWFSTRQNGEEYWLFLLCKALCAAFYCTKSAI